MKIDSVIYTIGRVGFKWRIGNTYYITSHMKGFLVRKNQLIGVEIKVHFETISWLYPYIIMKKKDNKYYKASLITTIKSVIPVNR